MQNVSTVILPTGETVPALGQGTWYMGEDPAARERELEALRAGLDSGLTLLDTAEMYGNGKAETLIAEAIDGRRDEVFIVSKVYPHNATRDKMTRACENSLKRLNTDRIDLYLLHWRGGTPLEETLDGFHTLIQDGRIRYFGVSNFDTGDMEELVALPGGKGVATNQILYNLEERGSEWGLLPWCRDHDVPVMAYSPLEHPRGGGNNLLSNPTLKTVADRHHATPAQIALAWLLHRPQTMVIPKAASVEHVRENRAAVDIRLDEEDVKELDRAFPVPSRKSGLAIR